MFYFLIETLRSYNYSNTPDLQKNFLFYRNLSTHLNIFDDILNVLFFIVGPADRKLQKTIYTLENNPIVIYIGVVFVRIRRTIPFKSQPKSRTLQTA